MVSILAIFIHLFIQFHDIHAHCLHFATALHAGFAIAVAQYCGCEIEDQADLCSTLLPKTGQRKLSRHWQWLQIAHRAESA